MADTELRADGQTDTSSDAKQPPMRLLQAEAAAAGGVQFSLPFEPNEIASVEIIDLDMVLVNALGERYVLPQAALQATLSPDKAVAKYKSGFIEPLAEQLKKAGTVKPVEGGSYRIEASDIKPVPGVNDKVGFEFNIGKEGDEVKTQEQVEQLAAQVQQISKSLQTASLSNSDAAPGKGPGQGPGAGPGTGKASASSASSVSTPSAPPKLNDKPKTEDFLFKVEEQPVQNKPMLVSTSSAKVTNVTHGNNNSTDFGEIEVRRMLAEKPFEVQAVANQPVTPTGPTVPPEMVSNDLKIQWLPSAKKLLLRWENVDGGLPPNLRVNDLLIKNQAVEVSAPTTAIARIKLTWDIADDLPVEVPVLKFKLVGQFVDADGNTLSTRDIPFEYGDFKSFSDTSAVDVLYLFARGMSYQIKGNADANNIQAGAGHDLINGDGGDDTLSGGRGDDTLQGGDGQDILDGNSGNDTVSYANFTQSADSIVAQLDGGSTVNKERGAKGDTLTNIENIIGSSGNDQFTGNNQSNFIFGGDGDDTLDGGGGGADTLDGGAGKNTLSYEASKLGEGVKINLLQSSNKGGDASDDKLVFGSFVHVIGTRNADELTGNASDNQLTGKEGNDLLVGNDGNDTLEGGAGNDTLIGGVGADRLNGGGTDERNLVSYKESNAGVQVDLSSADPQSGGDAQGDVLSFIQDVQGSTNNDTLKGDAKANQLFGDAGDDTLSGNAGNDTLDGGEGIDTVDFENSNGVTVLLLSSDNAPHGKVIDGIDTDLLKNIENIRGSNLSDMLSGNKEANRIEGRSGNDSLFGLDGNDTLFGGGGNDTLDGGKGADWLYGEDTNSSNPGTGNTVSYKNSNSSVYVYLDSSIGNTNGGDADGDKLSQIQHLMGSDFSDILAGDAASNLLDGGDGDDTLIGGAGKGNDTFMGGIGKDTVVWFDAPNQNGQTNTIDWRNDAKLDDKFESVETLDFQKDNAFSTVHLTADLVRQIADAGDQSEITVRLSSTDSYVIGQNELFAINKNKLTFYADSIGGQISAVVNIDQVSSQPPVDTTLQEVASRNVYHSSKYKMNNLKLADTSKEIDTIKPVLLLQEKPLQVNATDPQVTPLTPDRNALVLMDLSLPGLPTANKVVFSLADNSPHALPHGFGFFDGTGYQKFGDNKTSIEWTVDDIKVSKITMCWDAVPDVPAWEAFDFILDVKFYNNNQLVSMPSSRLGDPISFRFADYRKMNEVNALGDDSKGNPILYLPARGISYAINGTSNNDNISGGPGHDIIKAYAGNDSILGGMGDDSLMGGEGADTIDGGTGNNTASYVDSSIGVYVELASSLNNNTSKANYGTAAGDTLLNVQNLVGGNGDDWFVGNQDANSLVGGAGNDTLEGGKASDTLDGGEGKDTVSYEKALAMSVNGAQYGVTVDLKTPANNQGDDAVGDVYINIENIKGSNYADKLSGDEKDNLINGGLGDDTLEGGLGADTLDGGTVSNTDANNTVTYLNALEDNSGGIKGVAANLTDASKNQGVYAKGDVYLNIKNLVGTRFSDRLTGDQQHNVLTGDAGDDTLSGGAGADTLDGGLGVDWVSYDNVTPGAGISVSLKTPTTNTGEAAGDRYLGIENLRGTQNNDTLEGDGASNVIEGGGGNDLFYGSGGGDSFVADKNANSTVSYEKINSSITAYLASPQQSLNAGGASQDKYSFITNLIGSASNENKLYGDDKNNLLMGGAYNDTLVGGAGKDTLIGGSGIDLISYDGDTQAVTLSLVTGGASGNAEGDQYASIENVDGTGFGDQITGNESSNLIRGGAGDDVLIGGGGSDTLDGGDGDDIFKNSGSGNHSYVGGSGSNTVSYELIVKGAGVTADLTKSSGNTNGDNGNQIFNLIQNLVGSKLNDKLYGDQEKNNLSGGDGNDLLDGREGVDSLSGGQGNDTLIGGAGADTLSGGDGEDWASYETSVKAVTIDLTGQNPSGDTNSNDALNDSFDSIEALLGSNLNDTVITGEAKTNYKYDGGMGIDTLDFRQSSSGVNVNLKTQTFGSSVFASGGSAAGAQFQNFENMLGSVHGDVLGGDDQTLIANNIDAGKGNDVVYVTLGNDTLAGGEGIDSLDFSDIAAPVVLDLKLDKIQISVNGKPHTITYTGFEQAEGTAYGDKLKGNTENNLLNGGAGDDTLEGGGGTGVDTLQGDEGDDYFVSGEAVSTLLVGGSGNDTVDYTITRLEKVDITVDISQTGDATGIGLNDSLSGIENVIFNSGNDTFTGSTNTVTVIDSEVEGGFGNDKLTGGMGDDVLYGDKKDGSTSTDTTLGYNDTLDGGAGDDSLYGGVGNDSLSSSFGQDVFQGGTGDDVLSYASVNPSGNALLIDISNTTMGSGKGNGDAQGDVIGQDIETIIGSANIDTVFYSEGRNNLTTLVGHATRKDTVDYSIYALPTSTAPEQVNNFSQYWGYWNLSNNNAYFVMSANLATPANNTGAASKDRYVDIDHLNGSVYNDKLEGDAKNNSLFGDKGSDILLVSNGTDTLNGGDGLDLLSFERFTSTVNLTLTANGSGSYTFGTGNTVSYVSMEGLIGGSGNDTLTGNDADNVIVGGAGNDSLSGNKGNDTFVGGAGADTFNGGDGTDVVDYSNAGNITVNLQATTNATGDASGDRFFSIEKFVGSLSFGNTFIGNSSTANSMNLNEILVGGNADDVFHASLGADSYYGGIGNDTLDYQFKSGYGTNSTNSTKGIDITVDSFICDASGNAIAPLTKFATKIGYAGYNTVTTLTKLSVTSETSITETKIVNNSNGQDVTFRYKIEGKGNPGAGLTTSTDDFVEDKFFNVETVRGTDYNDKVTLGNTSNWGFSFISNNGQDSMTGGDGNDYLDFRKTAGATYGNGLEGNSLVGGYGADTIIVNEADMMDSNSNARNFKIFGDKDGGTADAPIYSGANGGANYYANFYVDELKIYAKDASTVTPGSTVVSMNLFKYINQIDRVEKIDISADSVKTEFFLSVALIQGLADNANNSAIVLKLKKNFDSYKIDTTGGYTLSTSPASPQPQINGSDTQSLIFKSGATTVATAYIEYV